MRQKINIDHLCRVEGHGGISVEIEDGKIRKTHMDVLEGARFFEALLVGKKWDDVTRVTSCICAICSMGHTTASLRSIEDAFGIKVSEQTRLLRELGNHGQFIESHALHVGCLALPDFLGFGGALDMAAKFPDEVKLVLSLKKLGNTIQEVVGGKAIHPINLAVGRFGKVPAKDQLKALREQLGNAIDGVWALARLFNTIKTPVYAESPVTYAALEPEGGVYGWFGNRIKLSTGDSFDIHDYRKVCNERTVAHSTAKQSKFQEKPFMTGSLARLVINYDKLSGEAKKAAKEFNIPIPSNNILHNNHAQIVELFWAAERSIQVIDKLLAMDLVQEAAPEIKVRAAEGVGTVEVPRGTLYHSYTFNKEGRIADSDIITPTAQNHANIEKDFQAALNYLVAKKADEAALAQSLEVIARAYDPCISCSCH
jgi:sulfhydrogenase subunit alpha